MDARLEELARRAEFTLFDYQQEFLEAAIHALDVPEQPRACLYYKTGAGKSFTSLAAMALWGYARCIVIAPPSTHAQWVALGWKLDIEVGVMSHAKFRMKDTKLSRNMPIIADEMHLFGGQRGHGWRKLDKLAQHLQAPLILASATPNYNDAERCYCIQHVLDPLSCRGGYLQFIYQHCETEQNPFGMEPKVLGFQKYGSAAEFLADLPGVYYLPDDVVIKIVDVPYDEDIPDELYDYSYNRSKHRMIASIIEQAHAVRYQGLVGPHGYLRAQVARTLEKLMPDSGSVLIFANHATVAEALARTFDRDGLKYAVITGDTPQKLKERIIQEFRDGQHAVLIGTASLATGTDGLDRVCDTLLILDDTDDDSLRRQLIGRIMPRGDYVSATDKQIFRLVPQTS